MSIINRLFARRRPRVEPVLFPTLPLLLTGDDDVTAYYPIAPGNPGNPKPLGYAQALIVSDEVASLPDIPAGSQRAVITLEIAGVRWRDDGVDPTNTIGFPLAPGTPFIYDATNLNQFRYCGLAGGTFNVTYY